MEEYLTIIKNKFGRKFKALHTDNAGEYTRKEMVNYLIDQGAERQLTMPHPTAHNGVEKRKNPGRNDTLYVTRIRLIAETF